MINRSGVSHKITLSQIKKSVLFPALSITDFFWVLFGMLILIPIEIGAEGLFLGYFQIIILFILSKNISKTSIFLYLIFCLLVCFSTMIGNDIRLTSLVNPLIIGLALIVNIKDKNQSTMIKNGLYISAAANSFFLMYLFSQENIGSLYSLLTQRNWASDSMFYFGNGLGATFSLAMLFASKEGKIKLVLLFFIGGLLTTSRVPLAIMAILSTFYIIRNINIKHILAIAIVGLLTLLGFFTQIFDFGSFNELDGIVKRLTGFADRQDVYNQALSKAYENPFIGLGSEKLEYFGHTHNSYLQIFYSYGLFAFICWLLLIYSAFFKKLIFSKNIDFILSFFVISFFQIGLLNPNLLLILIVYYCYFSENNASKFKKIK